MSTLDKRYDIPSATVEAIVAEPKIILQNTANDNNEVIVEIRLEFFRDGKRITTTRRYDLALTEEAEALEEHVIDLGLEHFDKENLIDTLLELPGLKVKATMFFAAHGEVEHYLIDNSREDRRIMDAIYSPEELAGQEC